MFKSFLGCILFRAMPKFKRLMPKEWVAEIVNLKAISSTIYISKVHNVEMSRTKAYCLLGRKGKMKIEERMWEC